jgi:hypothetical protein
MSSVENHTTPEARARICFPSFTYGFLLFEALQPIVDPLLVIHFDLITRSFRWHCDKSFLYFELVESTSGHRQKLFCSIW